MLACWNRFLKFCRFSRNATVLLFFTQMSIRATYNQNDLRQRPYHEALHHSIIAFVSTVLQGLVES